MYGMQHYGQQLRSTVSVTTSYVKSQVYTAMQPAQASTMTIFESVSRQMLE